MNDRSRMFLIVLAISSSACTFNVQPEVVMAPVSATASSEKQKCKVLLLVPYEFATREYVSSFEARQIRFQIGAPAMASIEALLRQNFTEFERTEVTGDGTVDLVRFSIEKDSTTPMAARPRFTRLESSVVPGSYNIEVGIALDFVGQPPPITLQGKGLGSAHLYTEGSLTNAANQALSQAITSVARALPTVCKQP
jgi:hypothetical protein